MRSAIACRLSSARRESAVPGLGRANQAFSAQRLRRRSLLVGPEKDRFFEESIERQLSQYPSGKITRPRERCADALQLAPETDPRQMALSVDQAKGGFRRREHVED